MNEQTAIGLFHSLEDLEEGLSVLDEAGFSSNLISLVTNEQEVQRRLGSDQLKVTLESAGAGAVAGAIAGGLMGVLAGASLLPLPGIGPVVASGSVAAAISTAIAGLGTGAASGGFMAALIGLGMSEEDAHLYTESVRRGNVLVAVEVAEERASAAAEALRQAGATDVQVQPGVWEDVKPAPEEPLAEEAEEEADTGVITALNNLIATCKDNEEGFHIAARHAKDADLREDLEEHARQYARFAVALQEQVTRLGGDPKAKGTVREAVRQGWINLKAASSPPQETTLRVVLSAAETGTEGALEAYRQALEEALPANTRSVVEFQYARIEEMHEHLQARLREIGGQ